MRKIKFYDAQFETENLLYSCDGYVVLGETGHVEQLTIKELHSFNENTQKFEKETSLGLIHYYENTLIDDTKFIDFILKYED